MSLASEITFRELWADTNVDPSTVQLCSYSGKTISVVGKAEVTIRYKMQVAKVPLVIVKSEGPSGGLMGWVFSARQAKTGVQFVVVPLQGWVGAD